jgi:hypothetical protein
MSEAAGYKVPAGLANAFKEERMDSLTGSNTRAYLNSLSKVFGLRIREIEKERDQLYSNDKGKTGLTDFTRLKTDYFNKSLAKFILNEDVTDQYLEKSKRIIRKYEPGFMAPTSNYGRAHFYAPFKIIGNYEIDTFWFNLIVIWAVSLLLYFALYFNILRKLVSGFEGVRTKRADSNFLIIKEISSW